MTIEYTVDRLLTELQIAVRDLARDPVSACADIGIDPQFSAKASFDDGILWANVNRRGDFNAMHTHPDAILSGCIYLKVDSAEQGAIQFLDAREGSPTSHWRCYTRLNDSTPLTEQAVTVAPREGDIVLKATAAIASTGSVLLTGQAASRRPLLAAGRVVVEVDPATIVAFPHGLRDYLGDGDALILTGASRTADVEKIIVRGIHGAEEMVVVLPGGA